MSVNFKRTCLCAEFFQKWTKKFNLQYYDTSGRLVFVRFLEELKTPKIPFEINWPLYGGNIYTSIFSTDPPSSHPDSCTSTHSPLTFEFCLLLWSFSHLRQTAYAKAGLQRCAAVDTDSWLTIWFPLSGKLQWWWKSASLSTVWHTQPTSQPAWLLYVSS